MSTVAIMQPYLFPYLGYFQLISAVDTFVLYDDLNYIKYGWINRNRLLAVNGPPFFFIVPVVRKSSFRKIRDVRIREGPWRRKFLNSIYYNYRRAPHFQEVFPLLESIISRETARLSSLNQASILLISSYLGIDTDIMVDPGFEWLEEDLSAPVSDLPDLFPEIRLRVFSPKIIRAIAVCRSLDANTLVNPVGGAHLYPKEELERNGIRVLFLKMNDIRYRQNSVSFRQSGRFHPSLSIIDVLMNCGKAGTFKLLSEYGLA